MNKFFCSGSARETGNLIVSMPRVTADLSMTAKPCNNWPKQEMRLSFSLSSFIAIDPYCTNKEERIEHYMKDFIRLMQCELYGEIELQLMHVERNLEFGKYEECQHHIACIRGWINEQLPSEYNKEANNGVK